MGDSYRLQTNKPILYENEHLVLWILTMENVDDI